MASSRSAPTHRWRRYWCLREGTYHLDDSGFLSDPETEIGRLLQRDAVPLEVLDDRRCLVLLGEPGIGKTTAIRGEHERLLADGKRSVLVDLARSYSVEALAASLRSDDSGPGFVFLDAFDEGLAKNPNLSSDLVRAIVAGLSPETRLRVTSRTLEWPSALEASLRDSDLAEVGVYELLPLRSADVGIAASDRGLNADEFLAHVQAREVVSLAIRPISLRFLIEMFSRDGTLPHSRTRLYDEGTLILCSEESAYQRGGSHANPDVFRRRVTAARLAALSIFTNRQLFTRSEASTQESLSVGAASGGVETLAGASYQVDTRAIEDVLSGTALFTAHGADIFGWSHQSYREFLAAWYLAQRDLPLSSIVNLYFPGGDRVRVPGPLREVAAWHATLSPIVFDLLVERDPEVLLHSDTAAASVESRAQLTESVLRRLATFEAIDSNYWRREYSRLAHPGLASQLRPRIRDRAANAMVRNVARNRMRSTHQPASDGAFHDVVSFIPAQAEDLRGAADACLEQHVDGEPLEQRREPRHRVRRKAYQQPGVPRQAFAAVSDCLGRRDGRHWCLRSGSSQERPGAVGQGDLRLGGWPQERPRAAVRSRCSRKHRSARAREARLIAGAWRSIGRAR